MKRPSNRLPAFLAIGLLASLSVPEMHDARASADLDRRFSLTPVGFLRSWDNVDGLFADYVAAAYKDYFARQSRFVLQDLSKADSVLSRSKLPYVKLIDDAEILSQLARATRAESVIRTKIQKERATYRFQIEWLHSPAMEVMATERFELEEPRDGQAIGIANIQPELHAALDRLIAKVPFVGQVTGRDEGSVTLDIGARANVHRGDRLVIGTIDEAKKHPLLKTIVDWRLSETGHVDIEQVEDRIAFGRVVDETPGKKIARYQKVLQIQPRVEAPHASDPNQTGVSADGSGFEDIRSQIPRLGYISAGLKLGGMGRQYALSNGTGKDGGGFLFGARGEAQLWFNRTWFADVALDFSSWTHSQTDLGSTAASTPAGSGSLSAFKLDVGYTYLVTGDFFGPRGWAKLGYQTRSVSLPVSAANLTGQISFSGLFLGIGGELPIRDRFGALLNIDFGVFTGATETGLSSGGLSSATDATIYLGGFHRVDKRLSLKAGLNFSSQTATFSSGTTVSIKETSFIPQILFYF